MMFEDLRTCERQELSMCVQKICEIYWSTGMAEIQRTWIQRALDETPQNRFSAQPKASKTAHATRQRTNKNVRWRTFWKNHDLKFFLDPADDYPGRSLDRSLVRFISEVRISNYEYSGELFGGSNSELLACIIFISPVSEFRITFQKNYDRTFLLFQGVSAWFFANLPACLCACLLECLLGACVLTCVLAYKVLALLPICLVASCVCCLHARVFAACRVIARFFIPKSSPACLLLVWYSLKQSKYSLVRYSNFQFGPDLFGVRNYI